MESTPLQKAIAAVGGQQKLADALGVTKQAITKWRKRVPAERVIGIVAASGGAVTCSELRPDIYPEPNQ